MKALPIREVGRLAYQSGLKKGDCPFALRSDARSWWLKGWNEARKAAEACEDNGGQNA